MTKSRKEESKWYAIVGLNIPLHTL